MKEASFQSKVFTFAIMKSLLNSWFLLSFAALLPLQADPLTRIADDVVKQTAFGEPTTKKDPAPTRYNLWMYQNFMLMEGMDSLGEVTGNESYKNYTSRNIDFFAAYQAKFGDSMTAGPAGTKKWYTKPKEMWQSGMIAAFAERQQTRPDSEFVRGMKILDGLLEKAPAFDDGVLVRKKSKNRGLGLQIDDLYMITPYWCRKAELLNDSKWLDRAIDESLHYFDYLWDKEDKLMHPLWLKKRKGPYGLYWGRGNGWYIMAVTDLLTYIPDDHPKRNEVLEDYRAFIAGIIQRQGKDGHWRQILDRPETYAETSCSGMFTYCILKGVNEKWLDSSFLEAGKKGWQGLLTTVNDQFEITGVCPPSDISEDPSYYLKGRAPKTHDQHGIGPFLLAGAEFLRASKSPKTTDVREKAGGLSASKNDSQPPNEKPNIILIMTDDMGFSDLGCYGGEIATPNLDVLAKSGLRFTQFYNTGRCCPTRASLMTGLYAHQAGMGRLTEDRGPKHPGYRGHLTERCVTLAEVLKTAGYQTFHTGKWHLGSDRQEWWPLSRGFDRSYGCLEGGGFFFKPSSYWGQRRVARDNTVLYDKDTDPPEGWYATDAWTDEGLLFVEQAVKKQEPFFWYLAHNAPHFPLQAKPEDIAKYRGKYKAGWDAVRDKRYKRLLELGLIDESWPLSPRQDGIPAWDKLSEEQKDKQDLRMATYAAMIDCVDQNVGKIIAKLKKLGVYENTLILFLHDNGGCSQGGKMGSNKGKGVCGTAESFAFYGMSWANASNTPFRRYKKWIHEGGIATPLIAHWPDGIDPALHGSLVKASGHVIDVMPTLTELTKASYPETFEGHQILPVEGVSFVPVFQGKTFERNDPLFFEHEGNRGVRRGVWKLVAAKGKPWELYNIEKDRTELKNLADQMPDKVGELSALYEQWSKRCFVGK